MPSLSHANEAAALAVAAFYRFVEIEEPSALAAELLTLGRSRALRGTILIAHEGINGSIAGAPGAVEDLLARLRSRPAFADLRAHLSRTTRNPFRRFKVKLRREIVSLGVAGITPGYRTGTRLDPAAWNDLLADPEVLVVDTRNDYEHRIGSFVGAVNPGTGHFREFPRFVAAELGTRRERPVAMFCTGGIRCEKASALLLAQGFASVYQLDGGILRYLSETAPVASLWRGDCFVFDDRIALDQRLTPADYLQCHGCRQPVSIAEREEPTFEPGVCCPACHDRLTPAQRAAFRERWRQQQLATARGKQHVGAIMAEKPARVLRSAEVTLE
ncbi:MAG: rhodanese-related sulfurtransferase [Gammaproteobacteria bacterium]